MKQKFFRIIPFVVVICLSFFAVKPLFSGGFFPMHDDTQVARVYEMGKALADGIFPVRWVSDLGYGYGYPIFNFYAPLAYYVGGIATFFTDALIATKIMFSIGILLAGISMYLFAKEFWGKIGGIVCAILYVYAPYHAVEIYVRGDVSEFFAYAFIPLVFYMIWQAYRTQKYGYFIGGSITYAGLILSHNLTALMVTPFLIGYVLVMFLIEKEKRKIILPFLIFVGGVTFSAWYWLPVLVEIPYTNILSQVGGGADFRDHFVCLQQLWDSQWGFGGSIRGCIDGMSFRVGKITVISSIISIIFGLIVLKREKKKFAIFLFSVISLIVCVLLTLDTSRFFWESISFMAFFQYPWRFLILISFFLSFIIGIVFWYIEKKFKDGLFLSAIIIIGLIIFLQAKLFIPQTVFERDAMFYTNTNALRWVASKISDEYMPKNFTKPKDVSQIITQKINKKTLDGQIIRQHEKTQEFLYEMYVIIPSTIHVNIAYFPGWHAFIDNKQIQYKITNKGLVIDVPQGQHTVLLQLQETPIERLANILSLTSIGIALLGIILIRKLDTKYEKKNS